MTENGMEYLTPDKEISSEAASERLEIYKMLDEITDDKIIRRIYLFVSGFYYRDNPNRYR
jgi:hypothetical protein